MLASGYSPRRGYYFISDFLMKSIKQFFLNITISDQDIFRLLYVLNIYYHAPYSDSL
jgi:hypothetical protein